MLAPGKLTFVAFNSILIGDQFGIGWNIDFL